jgi:hypothetical protein
MDIVDLVLLIRSFWTPLLPNFDSRMGLIRYKLSLKKTRLPVVSFGRCRGVDTKLILFCTMRAGLNG